MVKAVIFDMDGLMLDTEAVHIRAWEAVGHQIGFPEIYKLIYKCFGLPPENEAKVLKESCGNDFDYPDFLERVHAQTDAIIESEGVPLKKGIKELLIYLKKKGFKIAVASSTRSDIAIRYLKMAGLYEYLDTGVFYDMVKKGKPDPEIFLKAAENLGVEPLEAIVLEDSYSGIRGAYEGGFLPLMVPDMLEADDEMREKTAAICESLLEVKALLKRKWKLKRLKTQFFLNNK